MMDQIHKENLDQWFFKDVEGQLNTQEVVTLNDYLTLHPEELEAQESWQTANFERIEIEAFPKLDVLLKGKIPWWKKGWFIYNSIALVALIGVFYCFQSSETELNIQKSAPVGTLSNLEMGRVLHMNLNTLSNEEAINQNSTDLSETSALRFELKRADNPLELNVKTGEELLVNVDSIKIGTAVQKLSPNEATELIFLPDPEIVAFKPKENSADIEQTRQEKRESNKRERKFKRNTRKLENQRYEQSIINGSHPLIIPMENIGF